MKKIKLHTWLNNIWEEVFPETYAKLVNRDNEKPDVETSLNNLEADLTVKSVEIRDLYNNKLHIKPNSIDLLITDGKLNPVYIPDVILGQLQYGGAFNSSDVVTGSPYAELIGINLTTKAPADLAGFYFIYQGPTANHIFKGSEYNIGDWAVCNGAVTGSEWSKIDNTDAVTGVKGNTETAYRKGLVNITPANVGAVAKAGDEMTGDLKVPKLYVSTVSRRPGDTNPLTFTSTAQFTSTVTFAKNSKFTAGLKTNTISTNTTNEVAFNNSINLGGREIRDVETIYTQIISSPNGQIISSNPHRFNGSAIFSSQADFESDIHHCGGTMFLEDTPLKIRHNPSLPIQWSQFGSDTKFFADAGLLYLRNSNALYGETRTALVLCAASPTDADPTTYNGVTLYTPLEGNGLYVNKPVYESNGSRVYSSSSVVAGDNILINWNASTQKYTISAAMGVEAPYTRSLTTSSWSGSSGAYTFYIAASTHGKGTTPTVLTFVNNEQTYDSPTIDTSGNVTIKSNAKVAMRVIIKR